MEALKDVENTLKWKPGVIQGFRSSRQHKSKPPIPEPEIFFLLINISPCLKSSMKLREVAVSAADHNLSSVNSG